MKKIFFLFILIIIIIILLNYNFLNFIVKYQYDLLLWENKIGKRNRILLNKRINSSKNSLYPFYNKKPVNYFQYLI